MSDQRPRVIYLFYDGIGIGMNDSDSNPFSRYSHSYLSVLGGKSPSQALPTGWEVIPTDPRLGMSGLPQSASGQTALWTGVNGARIMGHHMTGFPGPTLIKVIEKYSIIKKFCEYGLKASLLNCYTEHYFERVKKNPRLLSVSSHIQRASGQAFLTLDDLKMNRALYMDYTHEVLHKICPECKEDFPVIDAKQRGADLAKIMQGYDLTIHEFFLTDKAGHARSWEMAEWCIGTIERFLAGLVPCLNVERDLLLISSDHGNMENLTTKTHTMNLVPTFAYGKFAKQAAQKIKTLLDIPRFIYEIMGIEVNLPVET